MLLSGVDLAAFLPSFINRFRNRAAVDIDATVYVDAEVNVDA